MNPHVAFFASLKQVERRLASENTNKSTSKSNTPHLEADTVINKAIQESKTHLSESSKSTNKTASESKHNLTISIDQQPLSPFSSSLIYINNESPKLLSLQGSDPPPEFLSYSPDFDLSPESSPPIPPEGFDLLDVDASGDEIDQLCDLLGLQDLSCGRERKEGGQKERCFCGLCSGGFLSKVGVKGPKCDGEKRRLEGWINYFAEADCDTGKTKEPLRLAHLLLAKAASEGIGGSGCIEFPETAQEFFSQEPPAS
ncbi:uncharacterized protein LOC116264500 [Nymphaea colorata]|nr:uncharacterized protein LOC116264500 [Nymphaea colorata]